MGVIIVMFCRGWLLLALALLGLCGCGTTRSTDTTRAATEMLLVSQAVDRAVGQIDFLPLKDKAVFLDVSMIDAAVVDKGYVISSLRQQLLASGALVMDERKNAVYVVEARVGAVGTDRHTLLLGTPQLSVPAIVPGVPTSLPEIALYKRSDQKGVAKLAVFAYNRVTGRAVWQSGLVEDISRQKDRWVLGSGPYSSGTIRRNTELAGEELPSLNQYHFPQFPILGKDENTQADPSLVQRVEQDKAAPGLLPTQAFQFKNGDGPPVLQPIPIGVLGVTGAAPIINHPLLTR